MAVRKAFTIVSEQPFIPLINLQSLQINHPFMNQSIKKYHTTGRSSNLRIVTASVPPIPAIEEQNQLPVLPGATDSPLLSRPENMEAVKRLAIPVEELKELPYLAHLNAEQLQQFSDSLLQWAVITYRIICKEGVKTNQPDIAIAA
jgi:hypothetical protein